jgi:hypothetical protein
MKTTFVVCGAVLAMVVLLSGAPRTLLLRLSSAFAGPSLDTEKRRTHDDWLLLQYDWKIDWCQANAVKPATNPSRSLEE